jgi:dTDP-D-glucose 4,6-dehydratase
MGGGSPKDNSAKVAQTQKEIAERQLEFDREEAKRQANYRNQTLAQQRITDDRRYALDGSKMRDMGWKPVVDFDESLKKTVEWTIAHPEWM